MNAFHSDQLMSLIRYACGCGSVLLVKIGVTLAFLQVFSPAIAYLLTHVVTIVVSYLVHTKFSFGSAMSTRGFRDYVSAVIAFKAADYLLFNVFFTALQAPVASVVIASLAVMILRYVVVRRILNPTSETRVRGQQSA